MTRTARTAADIRAGLPICPGCGCTPIQIGFAVARGERRAYRAIARWARARASRRKEDRTVWDNALARCARLAERRAREAGRRV